MISRRQAYLVSLVAAAAMILPWGVVQPPALDDLRNFVFDTFQRVSPRAYDPGAPTRVVGVDEESLKAYGQWPWPRTRVAALIDRLRELGAASIALDFIFAEPDRATAALLSENIADPRIREQVTKLVASAPSGDDVLARALEQAPVTLGGMLADFGVPAPPAKAGFVTAGDEACRRRAEWRRCAGARAGAGARHAWRHARRFRRTGPACQGRLRHGG